MPSPETESEEERFTPTGICLCDFCSKSPALLYCRADEARLCLACDRQVHTANVVSSKHPRALLCDSCHSAPASALCCSERLLLCHNCDFDAHRSDGIGHVRRPLEPFSGCPGAVELMGLLGVGDDEKRLDGEGEQGTVEDWEWQEKEVFCFDDLFAPMDAAHGFQALEVPPLPRERNLSCGKHKEEILRQLRGLVRSEFDVHDFLIDEEQDVKSQPHVPHGLSSKTENSVPEGGQRFPKGDDLEGDAPQLDECFWICGDQLILNTEMPEREDGAGGPNQSEEAAVEIGNDHGVSLQGTPLVSPRAQGLSGPERDSAISRYREKRKTRRYEKRVIYESRKTRAESRIRIKGRFAKNSRNPEA